MSAILAGSKKFNKGFYIIEILIVIAILIIALTTLLGVATFSLKISSTMKEAAIADALVKDTIEAVRNFRDGTSWNTDGLGTVTPGSNYYPRLDTGFNPPKMVLAGGAEIINGFTRKVVFERVSRNPTTQDIEGSYNPANDDPDTRKATATITWRDKKVEIITYFTNWKK